MANERTMDDKQKVLESPLKVGRGKKVMESCLKLATVYDEDAALNQNRSAAPEEQQVQTVLIKPKKKTKISTFNIRTAEGTANGPSHDQTKYQCYWDPGTP